MNDIQTLVNDEMSKIEDFRIAFISRVPLAEVTNARIAFYSAMLLTVQSTILNLEVRKIVMERLDARRYDAVEILTDHFIEHFLK